MYVTNPMFEACVSNDVLLLRVINLNAGVFYTVQAPLSKNLQPKCYLKL